MFQFVGQICPLLHLVLLPRLLSSSLINVSGGFGSIVDIFLEPLSYYIYVNSVSFVSFAFYIGIFHNYALKGAVIKKLATPFLKKPLFKKNIFG